LGGNVHEGVFERGHVVLVGQGDGVGGGVHRNLLKVDGCITMSYAFMGVR
jgi:hypothetical protein